MGKVISLAHKLIESEFEKSLNSLLAECSSLDEKDPNYSFHINIIKDRHTDSFLEFKNRILSLGYGADNIVCECEGCTSKVVDVLSK